MKQALKEFIETRKRLIKRKRASQPTPIVKQPGQKSRNLPNHPYKKYFIIGCILLFITYLIYLITPLFSLSPSNALGRTWDEHRTEIDNYPYRSLLLLGLDANDTQTYTFIDMAALIIWDKQTNRMLAIHLDKQTQTFLNDNTYPLTTLLNIGENENPDCPMCVVARHIENTIAFSIDHYIAIDTAAFQALTSLFPAPTIELEEPLHDPTYDLTLGAGKHTIESEEIIGFLATTADGKQNKLKRHQEIFKHYVDTTSTTDIALNSRDIGVALQEHTVYSDLSLRQGYNLIKELQATDDTQTLYLSPDTKYITEENTLAFELVNDRMINFTNQGGILKERALVEVLNGSDVRRAAARESRKLKNHGVSVTRSGNAWDTFDQTKIFLREPADKETYKATIAAIQKTFNQKLVIETRFPRELETTATIVVVIGNDQ